VGTVVEAPTESFGSSIAKKSRKRTFEEGMAIGKESGRFKHKYNDFRAANTGTMVK